MGRTGTTGTLGARFWLIFAASTLTGIANSASAPVLSRFATDVLGGTSALAGLIVSVSSFVSIIVQPAAGAATDRFGHKRVAIIGSILGAFGFAIILGATGAVDAATSRVVFGIGYAALGTAVMAWVISAVEPGNRGRALSLYGISIWLGLALGPQIGETVYQAWGYQSVWVLCGIIQVAALVCVLPAADPFRRIAAVVPATRSSRARDWRSAFTAVARPGTVAALAWSGEGFLLAFLIVHLEHNGLSSDGLLGAASVFTVFAASVIGTRLLLGGLPDRVGPVRTATGSLVVLAAGMAILGYSYSFPVAAVGAVLMGTGFAPLYPALTMLATATLDPARRGAGLGVFSAFTSIGYAAGAVLGGVVADLLGENNAFLVVAAMQLLAIPILRSSWRGRPRSR
ncbi:MFS transporter [Cryobacterium sp. SO2]|uniref:MFS transporter n=1 Tax=Cryobacterium sp. SO2 TaxID=1897060 RepID=UPI00223D9354|nr:MFS transporter [Cryobacterium sp. SO2]WEO75806.1 MFS transporter [Cryobacterium sp. SO2]